MHYEQALSFVEGLQSKGMVFTLDRIEKAAAALGNPHQSLKVIHVTGTNGKGSVCAMLSSILQTAGSSVGLYTSPHLVDIRERIKLNDKEILKKDFAELAERVRKYGAELTYFEFLTLMSFVYFLEKKVDYAVIEVGLGGRLDCTNIVEPQVSVITTVSMEHQAYLGNTVQEIAMEKAGIIKPKCTVVSGADQEALSVIKNICHGRGCRLIVSKPADYACSLKGTFQKQNMGIAAAAAHELGIGEEAIIEGLKHVKLAGRFHFIEHNIIVDCAHNPAAIETLRKEIELLPYRKLILVFGVLNDKDYRSMIKTLEPLASKIILCRPKTERAAEPAAIAAEIRKDHEIVEDTLEAVNSAKKLRQRNDLVVVTGSCYVAGEALCRSN